MLCLREAAQSRNSSRCDVKGHTEDTEEEGDEENRVGDDDGDLGKGEEGNFVGEAGGESARGDGSSSGTVGCEELDSTMTRGLLRGERREGDFLGAAKSARISSSTSRSCVSVTIGAVKRGDVLEGRGATSSDEKGRGGVDSSDGRGLVTRVSGAVDGDCEPSSSDDDDDDETYGCDREARLRCLLSLRSCLRLRSRSLMAS